MSHIKVLRFNSLPQHEFPNFQVDVHVLVLQDDGCSLAAAITCSGLALADAAVPMYDVVVGATKVVKYVITLTNQNECFYNHEFENYLMCTGGLKKCLCPELTY